MPDWCWECGELLDPIEAEFDHDPEFKKVFEISEWIHQSGPVRGNLTLQTEGALKTELLKGNWVHANCHRQRTARRERDDVAKDAIEVWVAFTGAQQHTQPRARRRTRVVEPNGS